MSTGNVSFIKDFVIVGFPGLQPRYYGIVSAVLFFVYVCTMVGNAVFFTLLIMSKSLQKPVYYFVLNLAVCDVLFSTTTLPKIISRYWFQDGSISFLGCFVQMFFVHYFGTVSSHVLALMAIDRYAAICYPLRYHTIMSNRNVFILSCIAWVWSCAVPLMVKKIFIVVSAMFVLLVPLGFIIFSFIAIIALVFKMSDHQARYKTLSTCTPQLIIILLYYVPRCVVYAYENVVPIPPSIRMTVVLWYSLIPPPDTPLQTCNNASTQCGPYADRKRWDWSV
ncbi:Main Olfactory Receptor [Triplophysa rosa]|uniref:Main Olfactory Receptor n=1 Tax=Triplophysa rosa TaxID=992332 RepID=A0A9W7TRV7_TRIRA|nr:Main Olfactory Receptor [Triplophysa rosa]